MEHFLAGLRAAAEPTRLRLLALCARGDLTVSELTQILGQSQPRVSRHLKLMCESGLLDRFREGSWVFYRLSGQGAGATLGHRLLELLPQDDPQLRLDRQRLAAIQATRAERAAAYFSANAASWNTLRSLHVDETLVEAALVKRLGGRPIPDLLDIGTGTGRMLELLAPQAERAVGVDVSREMLAVARTQLEAKGLRHAQVRQGDMYALPFNGASFDTAIAYQVLHYADNPQAAVAEAARVLKPGGRLALVDFAPHELEHLRDSQAHRRLGFSNSEVDGWCRAAGLIPEPPEPLPGDPLTVVIWTATKADPSAGDSP